jgi:nicotinamide-nucleotide amidase
MQTLNIEIINTGTELMLGGVLNTHHQWLARQLYLQGYFVSRQTAVPDTGPVIQAAVKEALSRADLIITTGGLGPTSDDLTRELVASLLGRKLVLEERVLRPIEAFYAARQRPTPPTTRVQALVPEGAQVLLNAHGTAPGLVIEVDPNPFRAGQSSSLLVMLPGPTRELRPMFSEQVLPLLRQRFPLNQPFAAQTLRTTGLGESVIEERIGPRLAELVQDGLELGYCAQVGQVELRLIGRGARANALVTQAESIIRQELDIAIFGQGDDLLETVVVRKLTEKHKTLALAESCTGGFLAHRITNVPGASAVLLAGWITYSNEAKQRLLGVRSETLAQHGAVSEATAREMAEGVRERLGTDYALSVTGIAGPAGGSEAKPVGTVFIGLATPEKTEVIRQFYPVDRETFKFAASQQALDLLRRAL